MNTYVHIQICTFNFEQGNTDAEAEKKRKWCVYVCEGGAGGRIVSGRETGGEK